MGQVEIFAKEWHSSCVVGSFQVMSYLVRSRLVSLSHTAGAPRIYWLARVAPNSSIDIDQSLNK
jgi:hypothetical protein